MTPFLIVKDFTYYIENEQDINEWADKCVPGWQLTGMILNFKNDQDRLAFLLRWD
jgi:hypothetical protein